MSLRLNNFVYSYTMYGGAYQIGHSRNSSNGAGICSLKLQFFIDCIRALNGTHLPVHVSPDHHPRYQNRKGQISQNVLAVCNLEMNFLYVLAGWEGSACNGQVFQSAHEPDFTIPAGHYDLADTGYAGSDTLLVPYHGVQYHLKEWGWASTRYIQATQ